MAEQILDPVYQAITAANVRQIKDNADIYAALLKLIDIKLNP